MLYYEQKHKLNQYKQAYTNRYSEEQQHATYGCKRLKGQYCFSINCNILISDLEKCCQHKLNLITQLKQKAFITPLKMHFRGLNQS